MAKRELSNTLKNLKFMQRAAPREEKINEVKENPEPVGSVFATANAESSSRKRWDSSARTDQSIVIFEGDPHPGALRGRMSFQSFNPSIDKLNEEATTINHNEASNTSKGNDNVSYRSEESKGSSQENISDPELKRKQPVVNMDIPGPGKFQKIGTGDANGKSSTQNPNSSNKQKKRENLDWNLLRPPNTQKKRS